MSCPTSIETTPRTSSKSFANWARRFGFTSSQSFRPSTKGEIVEIIRRAEEDPDGKVKWIGSKWSFMRTFESNDTIIESENIVGLVEIDRDNPDSQRRKILGHLTLTDDAQSKFDDNLFVHVKGGTKIFNVNRLLHGLPLTTNSDIHTVPNDELNLECTNESRAMPTLGGSGGQAIAGAIATGTHGGDIEVSPVADAIVAIHLIGPGGQEWWIEKSNGITAGTEENTQLELEQIAATITDAETEICGDIIVKKSDDYFNAVIVSLGRMGFTYSIVFEVERAFKLTESRRDDIWETYRNNISSREAFAGETRNIHYLNILIMPFANNEGQHVCKIAQRVKSDGSCNELPPNTEEEQNQGFDIFGFLCGITDARILIIALIPILATLGAIAAGLSASIGALLAIPFIGWALAGVAIAALAAVSAASVIVTGIIGYLAVGGRMTTRELIGAISDVATRVGLGSLVVDVLTLLFNTLYSVTNSDGSPYLRTNFSWKIMDTYNYESESFCEKVDSMDFAFDPFRNNPEGSPVYFDFIDDVLNVFEDLRRRNIITAGNLALRHSAGTSSLLGMSKFDTTCHIEIAVLRGFPGNAEFVERVQTLAKRYNAVPSWGQLFNHYNARDIRNLHQEQLITWRQVLTSLIRQGGGKDHTFSNNFTQTYNLEPWDDTLITSMTLNITVGNDHLGDTAWPFRNDISEDFVFIKMTDGTETENGLNQGSTWNAFSTHQRVINFSPAILVSQIDAVGIRHEAAGPDFAADNWTMNKIIITVTTEIGETREILRQEGNPIFQFQKNDNQIWEHFL